MKNVWTIAKRDFRAYFTSPIAYIVIAAFLVIMGWMFFFTLDYYFQQNMRFQQFGGKGISIAEGVIRPLYGNMNVILLFILPFVTMRLFAEERKNQTITLLLTSPLKLGEVIVGKYLSAVLLLLVMMSITLVYPITLFVTGNPEWGPFLTSYIGTILLAGSYLAIGVLYSAMTENQIVAGALTFATLLFFWMISWATQSAGPVWSDLLNYLSLIGHYQNFSRGILNTADLVYYLSFIGIGLFTTHRVLDSYRWR